MKRRTGCLIKRPSGYYVRVIIEGKAVIRALKNSDGTPIKNAIAARKAQSQAVPALIDGHRLPPEPTLNKTPEADTSNLGVPLMGCWEAYLAHSDRPDSGEHTLKAYKQYTRQFVDWVSEHHAQMTHTTGNARVLSVNSFASHSFIPLTSK